MHDFFDIRNQWALKFELTPQALDLERMKDRHTNPHNDSYKPPIRSQAEIHADVAYEYADTILLRMYDKMYKSWLDTNKTMWK